MRWKRIRPHLDFLYDLALRETGCPQDAEDIVQEVAASALRAKDPDLPRAYLAGAVLRRVRHLWRGETRRRAREAIPRPPRPQSPPDQAALVRDEVERALSSLAPDERRAVVLRHLHDLDYGEIGKALGVAPATARQRVHRALARMRRRFGADGEAAIALLPLFTAPRSLTTKPVFAGGLLMKTTTQAAIALFALAAGAGTGAVTAPRHRAALLPERTPRRAVTSPPVPDLEEEVKRLRAELERYPPLDEADALVYADTSLHRKLAGIDRLPEEKRVEAVRRIGERFSKTGDIDEALALLRKERDDRVLFWLGQMLYVVTVNSDHIPDDVRAAYAGLAVEGDSPERRRAALPLAVGKLYTKARPEWEEALGRVLRQETDPRVLRRAAEVLAFVWIEQPGERLLDAYRRMPPGGDRRYVAIEYRRWSTLADVMKLLREARDPTQRDDWVHVVGFMIGEWEPEEVPKTLRRIYGETPDARTRAWLALRLIDVAPVAALKDLVPIEIDRELCALLERITTEEMPRNRARRLLKEYGKR